MSHSCRQRGMTARPHDGGRVSPTHPPVVVYDAGGARPATSVGLASRVAPVTAAALRCWLQVQRCTHAADGRLHAAEVRPTMWQLAELGHASGAPVERLILRPRRLWATLPRVELDGDGPTASRVGSRGVLDDSVPACIEEFYAHARRRTR